MLTILEFRKGKSVKEKKMTERRQEFTPPTISSNQVKVPLKPGRGLSNWMRLVVAVVSRYSRTVIVRKQ